VDPGEVATATEPYDHGTKYKDPIIFPQPTNPGKRSI